MVNRADMQEAFADAEALLARAGGVLSVVVDRATTEIPGEMVTISALFEWKDRTDAKPQPEPAADQVLVTRTGEELAVTHVQTLRIEPEEVEPAAPSPAPVRAGALDPDAVIDREGLPGAPEVDETSVEEALQV